MPNTWLDMSKWFNYINQDLDNTHWTSVDTESINHSKMERYLGMSISTIQPSNEEIDKYIDSLDMKDVNILRNLWSQWYSFNDAVAYLENKDKFVNPMAQWNWIFAKRYQPSNTRDVIRWVEWAVLWPELLWQGAYSLWSTISNFVDKSTKRDVERWITDDISSNRFDYAKSKYDEATKNLGKLKEWDEWYEIAKAEQEKWAKEMDRYNNGKRMSTLDAFEKEWVSWTDYEKAVGAWTKEYKLWQEEVQPILDSATTKYKKIDFIDKLKADMFPDINEADWKKYYEPIVKEWKKVYKDWWDISLQELWEWKNTYKPSTDNIKGNLLDSKEWAYRRLVDEMHNMLNGTVKDELNKIKPWAWESYTEYSRLEEWLDEARKWAVRYAKSDKSIKWTVKNKGKWLASKTANVLKNVWKNIKPSTWIEKWLTKLWLPSETISNVVKTAESGEKMAWKVWKWWWKLLWTIMPIVDALVVWEELANTDERYELSATPANLSKKILWKEWLAKWTPYENYTEEDWEREWLWQDVVRAYLDSEEFERWLELTAYNSILFGAVETNSRDRLRDTYMKLYY